MSGPIMVDVEGLSLTDDDRRILSHPLTGGVILFARNFENRDQVRGLVSEIHAIKTPSLIVAVDQEGGRVQRFKNGFTVIPPMRNFGRLFANDPLQAMQLCEDLGWLMACELRDVGMDLNFAPVVDLDHGCSEVIGNRAFDRDPDVVTKLATAFIGGHHSGGVSTCVKHFPGHGAVVADSHVELPEDSRKPDDVAIDLLPFKRLMKGSLAAVMTAHVVVSCEDNLPVSFSKRWLLDVLRSELGFGGVVFSDDLSMKGAEVPGGIVEKVARAYAAGCDFLPICNDREAVEVLYEASPKGFKNRLFKRLRSTRKLPKNYSESIRYKRAQENIADLLGTV